VSVSPKCGALLKLRNYLEEEAGILPGDEDSVRHAFPRLPDLFFPLAGGEMVSQGSLEPLFQVRILARQPHPPLSHTSMIVTR
jgi:hypothetical protein